MTYRQITRTGVCVILSALAASACGGSSSPTGPSSSATGGTSTTGGTNTNPPSSTGGSSVPSANVTVNIAGSSGSQSFSPNPVAVAVAQTLAFRNGDSAVHRIVADNGAFDSGTIDPGGQSAPITINTANPIPFHCTIHPSMVGTTGSSAPASSGDPTPAPGY